MRRAYVLTICLALAIAVVSAPFASLTSGDTLQKIAAQQSPSNDKGKSLSPGDGNKKFFVPSCTLDSSLLGKKPADKGLKDDWSAAGKAEPEDAQQDVEIGSLRCQV